MSDRLRLGVSACLLGQEVRYDGQHKLDRYVTDTLGRFVEFVAVCPEVECGLSVPREAMRLVGDPDSPRLVTIRTGMDMTERMQRWAGRRVNELAGEGLCGFVFKSKSPSSGMERVKVYPAEGGQPGMTGVGMFAKAFMDRFPMLPVEEDGRLHDAGLRENFVERVFTMHRWQTTVADGLTVQALTTFHARHKLLLMAHSPTHYARMGRLAAGARPGNLPDTADAYIALLMEGMHLRATTHRQVNVLQHIMGHFRKDLTPDEKQELLEVIADYRAGHLPLIVPVTLLKHYVRKYGKDYLAEQYYLSPHPIELQLRNHV